VGQDTLLVVNNHLESNKIYGEDVKIYEDMISMPNDRVVLTNAKKLLKKLEKPNTIRAKQADVVKEFINRSSVSNIIVCGDFNDTPISYTHRVLSEGMNDAFAESGNGFGFSYNKNRMYFRIDHILVSKNLSVYNCTVDNASDASDHYPIWCYISFKKDME
jgi:endonuclease/exonuclease/phosphatase (EEP) superfamily protein YafD